MPLRVVGPRVLLKPIQQESKSEIVLTDRVPPTVGEVIGIGTARCEDCERQHAPDFQIGDVVLIPAAAGQEIKLDGDPVWVVPISAVLCFWKGTKGHNADLIERIVTAVSQFKDGEHVTMHLQGEDGAIKPWALDVLPAGVQSLQKAVTHVPVEVSHA